MDSLKEWIHIELKGKVGKSRPSPRPVEQPRSAEEQPKNFFQPKEKDLDVPAVTSHFILLLNSSRNQVQNQILSTIPQMTSLVIRQLEAN
jgi:hypothetical protein